jgi:hypothetical protein
MNALDKSTLIIKWQWLVDEKGCTCPRCKSTEAAVEKAIEHLGRALAPLNMEVILEKMSLTPDAFARDPLGSNRVWVSGRPLEEWLGARVGQSPCCEVCGEAECRTLDINGRIFEDIPAELIIRAGLKAAAEHIKTGR